MASQNRRIIVSPDGRYLQRENGNPFLYIGDTAWELFHRLSIDEADRYLTDRADKGFTVIQAVVLAELDGLTVPNANGDLPLVDPKPGAPITPNEPYFAHVDAIVRRANELGLVIGMLPTWGRYWKKVASSQTGPDVGDDSCIFTTGNAKSFGEWIGTRYASSDLIWILGGDRDIDTDEERALLNAMAAGLKSGDGGAHLCTFHPRGPGRSREQLDGVEWVDFHMCQTSHAAAGHDTGIFIDADYAMDPPMPTVDGEPRYESIPIGFYLHGNDPAVRFTDYDARTAAWCAILAGACGHTYGNNNIWQMYDEGRKPIIGANVPWHRAIAHPGATQMGYMRELLESVGWWKLRPVAGSATFVVDGPDRGAAKIRAGLAPDGSVALVYSPKGEPFSLRLTAMGGRTVRERWFNPRYGTLHPIHTATNRSFQTYTPPTHGDECDWVLVLDVE